MRSTSFRNPHIRAELPGIAWYWKYPRTTDCNHFTVLTFDWWRRFLSSALISFRLADMRLPIVSRLTMKWPVLRVEPQMWRKPKKSKVYGCPRHRAFGFS